jgi:hypothetical protein
MDLREFLSRYTQDTVPDLYFYAWRIFFAGYNPKNRLSIVALAERDYKEEVQDQEQFRLQRKFNIGRVMNDDLHRGNSLKSNGLKRREVNG